MTGEKRMKEEDVSAAQTLMLVGAHHDDNELNAGTIARHVNAGWRVVSVVVTDGRYTRQGVGAENVDLRNEESRAAARLLKAEPEFLGLSEGGFADTEESTLTMTAAIRRHRPDVLVTHPPVDYHSDHMAVSRCVLEAWRRSWNAVYECGEAALEGSPSLYYCDGWFVPFVPDLYVDVTAHMDLKAEALACHRSQLGPGGPAPGDMIDLEKTRARYRGIEAGVQYAEAFRFVPGLGKVRMMPLLA